LHKIAIDDEKWVYYDNLKKQKSNPKKWINSDEPSTLTVKSNMAKNSFCGFDGTSRACIL